MHGVVLLWSSNRSKSAARLMSARCGGCSLAWGIFIVVVNYCVVKHYREIDVVT